MDTFGSYDLLNALRAAKGKGVMVNEAPSQETTIGPPSGYAGEIREKREESPTQKRINAYLEQPLILKDVPRKIQDLDIVFMRPESLDFLDDKLMGRPAIKLERYSDEKIVALGQAVLPMTVSGFSIRGAAAIFVIAFHLKKPESYYTERYVFGDANDLESVADKSYEEFSDQIMTIGGSAEEIRTAGNVAKEAAVYSFIAASMLRLFTKPANNYVLAWNHIIAGFSKFYGYRIDIRLPTPTDAAMKGLANWFSIEPRAKMTLYRLLYLSNQSEEYLGMKRFLYDIYLSNTGMHIVDILLQICKITGTSPSVVLTIINEGATVNQVRCLVTVVKLIKSTSEHHKKQMWRYGRLFDETFLASIQTKSCPKLVYTMAAALRMADPKRNGGILNIVQLGEVSRENREKCEAAACQLLKTIRNYQKSIAQDS